MSWKGGSGESRIYIIIAVLVIVVVVFAVILSGRELTTAYVSDDFLDGSWGENLECREAGSHLLGLEKWSSLTYEADGIYPAYLTVTTIKTLVMMNEDELRARTVDAIGKALQQGVVVDNNTKVTGERVLNNKHKTMYVIYDGNDTSKNPRERIKIIGEVWNCGPSGTSIICIGFAQVTDNLHNNSELNIVNWEKLVGDKKGSIDGFIGEDGLIFNIICH